MSEDKCSPIDRQTSPESLRASGEANRRLELSRLLPAADHFPTA
ncbi:MAG: hypothetical protein WCQ77_03875 [Planctomycetota bacterium]